jgi:hypothetical protein
MREPGGAEKGTESTMLEGGKATARTFLAVSYQPTACLFLLFLVFLQPTA